MCQRGLGELDSAFLAHFMLNEKLHTFGILGCLLCIVGSIVIVLHAPPEGELESVKQIWNLALQPGVLLYVNDMEIMAWKMG